VTGSLARLAAIAAIGLLLATFVSVPPARADGEGETTKGYLLVQQALGHLAHDTGMSGIDLAMEKVDDALETDDQEGVDVAELEQGMAALEAGDVDGARTLLQDSIQQAITALPPATGSQTGTLIVPPELSGRPNIRTQDWVLVSASILALALGVWLTFLFRPHDTIRKLRTCLPTAPASGPGDGRKEA
jgi:hypothetical protein